MTGAGGRVALERKRACGFRHRGNKRLVLDIDDETFDQIRRHARAGAMSVSAAVRELVEWGIETANAEAGER